MAENVNLKSFTGLVSDLENEYFDLNCCDNESEDDCGNWTSPFSEPRSVEEDIDDNDAHRRLTGLGTLYHNLQLNAYECF